MLKPLRTKSNSKEQISQARSLVAPIRGWYVGSPMAEAPAGSAFLLENVFPEYDYVRIRGGSIPWATGMPGAVQTLMPYTNGVTTRLFAYCQGSIFDASNNGPVGLFQVTGLSTSALMSYVQYSGTGPQTLVCANGTDPLQFYNGTSWSTSPAWNAGGTSAIGIVTFASQPVDQSTITLNGTVVKFATAASSTTVTIGANLGATLINLQTFLNGSSDPQISLCSYLSTTAALNIAYVQPGTAGNIFTIAASTSPQSSGTVSAPTLTGGSTIALESPISFVWQYNHRIYGIAARSSDVYYTDVNAIGGATTIFPMGPLLKYGGKLVAGGVWNQLTSNGEMYLWFVISSEGEIVLFTGSFPGDTTVTPWTQIGCYKVGRPLSQDCINSAGADVSIMTEDGIVAMSKLLTLDQIALSNQAVTQPIAPAYKQAVQDRVGKDGWKMTFWPLKYMAIVNMPQLQPPHIQFVANARTGAWCRFSGWDARCFAVHGLTESKLYYGTSDGRVMQAETGGMDDSNSYTGTIFYSYSGMGSLDVGTQSAGSIQGTQQPISAGQSVARKNIKMVRARFQTNLTSGTPKVTIKTNYDTTIPPSPPSITALQTGTNWDVGKWDTDMWQGPVVNQIQNWVPVYALGAAIAPVVQMSLKTVATPDLRLTSIDVVFEPGNMFG